MTRCYVSEQIAAYCNEPEDTIDQCWDCESLMIDEDALIEVETPNRGNQHVCEDCAENYKVVS